MAKSLAFWIDRSTDHSCNGRESCSTCSENNSLCKDSIDLHINYWLLHQDTSKELCYLDIGVKFKLQEPDKTEAINIYFPFKVTKENYYADLGALVCSRTELIQAIFNTKHLSSEHSSNTSIDLKLQGDSILRMHTQISITPETQGASLIDVDNGSILSLPIKIFNIKKPTDEQPSKVENYFRFRVIMDKEKLTISQRYRSKDNLVLSRLESTEIVDFRLNEVRDLPRAIQSKDLSKSRIQNIHFFLIREIDTEYKQAHSDFKRCRVLEKELWDDYLNPSKDIKRTPPSQMLIYHWKESGEQIDKFTAFAKFSKITVTKARLYWYILLATILFGAVSGSSGNFVYGLLEYYIPKLMFFLETFYMIHFT